MVKNERARDSCRCAKNIQIKNRLKTVSHISCSDMIISIALHSTDQPVRTLYKKGVLLLLPLSIHGKAEMHIHTSRI